MIKQISGIDRLKYAQIELIEAMNQAYSEAGSINELLDVDDLSGEIIESIQKESRELFSDNEKSVQENWDSVDIYRKELQLA